MKRYDTAQPYSAAVIVIKRDGKYLFVHRTNTDWMNGYYGLPGGKVERNEGFRAAAIREAKEEVGIALEPDNIEFALMMWRKEEGDTTEQEWCDAVFVAREWHGEPYNAEPHAHDEIAWFAPDALPENVIPATRTALEAIERGERYVERNTNVAK